MLFMSCFSSVCKIEVKGGMYRMFPIRIIIKENWKKKSLPSSRILRILDYWPTSKITDMVWTPPRKQCLLTGDSTPQSEEPTGETETDSKSSFYGVKGKPEWIETGLIRNIPWHITSFVGSERRDEGICRGFVVSLPSPHNPTLSSELDLYQLPNSRCIDTRLLLL